MHAEPIPSLAATADTQFIESRGRRLAYRSFGSGQPIVLCLRFRGTMDEWDPLFLDTLAACGLRVVIFDYSGLGRSGGEPTYQPMSLAQDAVDLIEALDLHGVAIGGWSIGGVAAQIVLTMFPQRIRHAVLIGTTPPGKLVKLAEPLFFETAGKEFNTAEDNVVLFFEPQSPNSRAESAASLQRMAARRDPGPKVDGLWAREWISGGPRNPVFPSEAVLEGLKTTSIPMLHIGGDHDIIFPVENWYALNQQIPNLQLLTFPSAGHGPQHQYAVASAEYIAIFLRTAKPAA